MNKYVKAVCCDEWQSLKSSSLFGESLRVASQSTVKVAKAKDASLVTRCEIGDSLVSYLHSKKLLAFDSMERQKLRVACIMQF